MRKTLAGTLGALMLLLGSMAYAKVCIDCDICHVPDDPPRPECDDSRSMSLGEPGGLFVWLPVLNSGIWL